MKNKKAKGNGVIIFIIIIAIAIGLYFYFTTQTSTTPLMKLQLYDSNMNPIPSNNFAIVNGQTNATYAAFIITATNKDTVTLNLYISSFTSNPTNINTPSAPTGVQAIAPNQNAQWATSVFNVSTYVNLNTNFCVNVTSQAISGSRNPTTISGCYNLNVLPDVAGNVSQATFTVNLTGGASGGINPICSESWTCGSWSVCSSGTQTRVCTDSNNCGTTNLKPNQTQTCTAIVFTKGSTCVGSGYAIYSYLPSTCTLTLDADNNGVADTWLSSNNLNQLASGKTCADYGQLATSYSTPEGPAQWYVRYSPSTSPQTLYICTSSTNQYVIFNRQS